MGKKIIVIACMALAFCFMVSSVSFAAQQTTQTAGQKVQSFWQKLFNYPANVTKESAGVVADTGMKGTEVTVKEVKRVGQVTSGDLAKTKELVTEPITGTAQMGVDAVKDTAKIPVEAAKEEPQE